MPRLEPFQHRPPAASLRKLEVATKSRRPRTERARLVYLLLDCSWSMEGGSKMADARAGAREFANQAAEEGYAVGLITFASTAARACGLERSLEGFHKALEATVPRGITAMAEALELVTEEFMGRRGDKVICLVTDGMPDNKAATVAAARAAKRAGIDIMAIGTDDADQSFLAEITTRRELARTVRREVLKDAVSLMALLLPGPRGR